MVLLRLMHLRNLLEILVEVDTRPVYDDKGYGLCLTGESPETHRISVCSGLFFFLGYLQAIS